MSYFGQTAESSELIVGPSIPFRKTDYCLFLINNNNNNNKNLIKKTKTAGQNLNGRI